MIDSKQTNALGFSDSSNLISFEDEQVVSGLRESTDTRTIQGITVQADFRAEELGQPGRRGDSIRE